jgi:hypothetical protein
VAQEQLEQNQKNEQQNEDGRENGSSEGGHGGFKTAAAASVAAGVGYLIAKRALDQRGSGSGSSDDGEKREKRDSGGGSSRKSDSLRSAVDVLTWDRAQEMLLPMAERAAGAVGSYVARETPDVVSERLVPRFIDAFNKARSKDD